MTIQYGDIMESGRWTFVQSEEHGKYVAMSCPDCGRRFALNGTGNHTVHDDGKVTASALCDCGFHEFVTLEGYTL